MDNKNDRVNLPLELHIRMPEILHVYFYACNPKAIYVEIDGIIFGRLVDEFKKDKYPEYVTWLDWVQKWKMENLLS